MVQLLHLPGFLGAALAIAVTVAIATVPFVVVRRWYGRDLPDPTASLAGTVAFRVGALHGLILALVFADAQQGYTELREAIAKEAAAVAELADDLDRYDDAQAQRLRHVVREYIEAVVDDEWPGLNQAALSARVWQLHDLLDLGVLELAADDERERSLRLQMLTGLNAIADYRHARLFSASRTLPTVFWYVALIGFALTVSLLFVFQPTPLHVLMLGIYGAYTGLVLYFILAMHHPFVGPARIEPDPFHLLLQGAAGVDPPR